MRPEGRVAVYYAPALDDPLWAAGSAWLGRDAATGRTSPEVAPGLAARTRKPCGYGFHATLKAPFRLQPRTVWEDVLAAATRLCAAIAPFPLPRLAVGEMDGYLALLAPPAPPLQALADQMVAGLDAWRAPLTIAERARRRAGGLDPAREAMLNRWGYPDVFDQWRFHMTLTEPLTAADTALYRPAAEAFFAPACETARSVSAICLFVQDEAAAPFRLGARVALAG